MTHKQIFGISGVHGQLAEVWGDVVSRPQLGKAILVSAVSSVTTYGVALVALAPLASTPSVGKAMALLAGIVGSVIGGAVCSVAFLPKRIVVDGDSLAAAWQFTVLEQLEQDEGNLGDLHQLPPEVLQEMRAVGLYDVFRDFADRRQSVSGSDRA
jgi:hypothetical protein